MVWAAPRHSGCSMISWPRMDAFCSTVAWSLTRRVRAQSRSSHQAEPERPPRCLRSHMPDSVLQVMTPWCSMSARMDAACGQCPASSRSIGKPQPFSLGLTRFSLEIGSTMSRRWKSVHCSPLCRAHCRGGGASAWSSPNPNDHAITPIAKPDALMSIACDNLRIAPGGVDADNARALAALGALVARTPVVALSVGPNPGSLTRKHIGWL